MALRQSSKAMSFTTHNVPGMSASEPNLLNALFRSSTVGVAICDRQLRFRAVNDALAVMNGVPAEAHLGRTIHAVLGSVAAKIQPVFEHVFATGQPLSNFELTAELPSRKAVGHWNGSYFPIKDPAGQVLQVGAIVLEITRRNELEASLFRLKNNLTRITSALRQDSGALDPQHSVDSRARRISFLARSGVLLESCASEARAISELLQGAPALAALQPFRHRGRAATTPRTARERRKFASARPIEDEVPCFSPLSLREQEVIALLAAGRSNKEVGSKLFISTRTVESHRARIMLKLDLHSFSELVRYAIRIHLIDT